MKRIIIIICSIIALWSCRIDLMDRDGNVAVTYILKDSVLYNQVGSIELVKIILYDHETGKQAFWSTSYLKDGIVLNVLPGTYDIVAYTVGTTVTQFTHIDKFSMITAESTFRSKVSGYKVVNSPDHCFINVTRNHVIPITTGERHEIVLELTPLLDSWKLNISGMKGMCNYYLSDIEIFNQSTGTLLCDMSSDGVGGIYFQGDSIIEKSDTIVSATFNTFRMRPQEDGKVTVHVTLKDNAGFLYEKYEDVTLQVVDPDNIKHLLYMTFDATLQPLKQGGFDPTTEEWDENDEHYELQ